jgi:hypothetical protein
MLLVVVAAGMCRLEIERAADSGTCIAQQQVRSRPDIQLFRCTAGGQLAYAGINHITFNYGIRRRRGATP